MSKMVWGWPWNASKAHVFIDGRSLCCRWLFFGGKEIAEKPKGTPGPDDCLKCHKELMKRWKE